MLRTIRKYQKSVLGIVAIGLVALAMSGFGVDFLSKRKEPYAIKVGEAEIPLGQVLAERRSTEDRYQQMLGEAYGALFKTLQRDLPQQVVDQVVNRAVLEQASTKFGLYVGDEQIRTYITQELFPGGFSPEQYAAILRRQGVDARQFEDLVRSDLQRAQLTKLASLAALPSPYEARAALIKEEQTYDVQCVALDKKLLQSSIPEPTEEAIKIYYESNASMFEVPAKVAYSYVELLPEEFESQVEIHAEDIEIEYSDNLKRFMTPAEVRVRHVQLNFPKDADETARNKTKTRAEEALAKAKAGEDFTALARQYSADATSSMLGGSLGWLQRGKMNPAFDRAAFELTPGTVSELVEAPYGYHIIKVEERREPRQKPLAEVRTEIETLIRKRESPALVASLAKTYAEDFKKSSLSLEEFLKTKNVSKSVQTQPLSSEKESPSGYPSLTKLILENSEKGVVDLKNSILFQVTERKEIALQSLAEAKPAIIVMLKDFAAAEAVTKKAEEISTKIKAGELKDIKDIAKSVSGVVVPSTNVKLKEQTTGVLANAKAKSAIASVNMVPKLFDRSFLVDGSPYFVQVNATKLPDDKEITEKLNTQKQQAAQQLAQVLSTELVEKLKSETEIEVKAEALR